MKVKPPLARVMAATPLLLAGTAGLGDALWHGDGLDPASAVATTLFWIALALPVSIGLGVAGIVLSRLLAGMLRDGRQIQIATLVIIQASILMAIMGGFVGIPAGLVAATLALMATPAFARPTHDPARWVTRLSLALLWIVVLSCVLPLIGGTVARSFYALVCMGTVAATLTRNAPSKMQARAALVGLAGFAVGAMLHLIYDARSLPSTSAEARPASLPNVVLIVLDTQRADHLGAYGHPGGLTPHFDELARESTLYERCFATAGWTVPSHASLFTGLYPQSHGSSFEHHPRLDDHFTTLAESLQARGYRTAGFVANEYIALANLDQGIEHFEAIGRPYTELSVRRVLQLIGFPSRFIDHGVVDGIDRIESYLSDRALGTRPHFLFINLLEPHWRHFPPLAERLAELPAGINVLEATLASARFYGPLAMAAAKSDPRRDAAIAGLYAATVRYQDKQFARLLAVLDAHFARDDTLLIVTNDHGENLGEAGRWDHVFAVNDYLVHSPLLIRHPRFPAGERIAGLCSQVDIPATVADIVGGLELAPSADARSLAPRDFTPRSFVFAAGDPYLGHLERMAKSGGLAQDPAQWNRSLRSARDASFKYVESSAGESWLYDLSQDPDESTDISSQHPIRVATMREALRAWDESVSTYRKTEESDEAMSDEDLRRLRRLGYVE